MPERHHEKEAEKLLTAIVLRGDDDQARSQSRRLLAEALERAERRGRERSGSEKESSG